MLYTRTLWICPTEFDDMVGLDGGQMPKNLDEVLEKELNYWYKETNVKHINIETRFEKFLFANGGNPVVMELPVKYWLVIVYEPIE